MEHGFEPMPIDTYWEMKRQRKNRHDQLVVSSADGIYSQFLATWLQRIEQREYLKLDLLQPGAFEKLQEWRAVGLKMILVTMRNDRDTLLWQLDMLKISSMFDAIMAVGSACGSAGKAGAARSLIGQADIGSVLWIGDTEVDLESARALGVASCLLGNGLRIPDYLAELHPDYLLPDIRSVDFFKRG